MDGKRLGSDDDTQTSDDLKSSIQDVIWRMVKRFDGQETDAQEVAAALSAALADAGIPEQPHSWVDATALEIAGGRFVVMDVRDEVGGNAGATAEAIDARREEALAPLRRDEPGP